MKDDLKCVFFSMLGLFFGLILVDVDHLFNVAYFHWFPITFFFLFFGIGLFLWRKD
ncbi:MAG: hypothetical protein JW700_03950 [Candidatus Aenigmarchaeota archaeon]|nr:hypothetical protein [Candidatus Aenigmarchaeota archaeon]